MNGLLFTYYTRDTFSEVLGSHYELLEWKPYAEMEKDDSFYVVLRRVPCERIAFSTF